MSAQPLRIARVAGVAALAVALTAGCAAGKLAQTSDERASIDGSNASVRSIDLRAVSIQAPPRLEASYRAGSDATLNVVLINNARTADRLTGITSSVTRGWAAFASANDAYNVQSASDPSVKTASPSPSASPSDSVSSSESASVSDSASDSASSSPSDSASSSTSSSTSSSSASASSLPSGVTSVSIPAIGRVGFGTPEATGGLLLTGLTRTLRPGDTVRLTFTFANAGSVTVAVPVQLSSLPRTAVVPGGAGEG